MPSISKLLLAATAILAALVSATPVAQKVDNSFNLAGLVEAIETILPKVLAYEGVDPGPLQVPAPTKTPAPSPRYSAPIKVVSDL